MRFLSMFACAAALSLVAFAQSAAQAAESVHRFTLTSIDGEPLPLNAYRGSVILVVNTASRCGYTGQYEGLQALWAERRNQNFVLIGAPSRDFARQEFSEEAKVKEFCEVTFGIDFPMTEIMKVRGESADPFFKHLAAAAGEPSWNFNKYLIDQSGRVVARYKSSVTPARIAKEVDALLTAVKQK